MGRAYDSCFESLENRCLLAATTPPTLLVDANPGPANAGITYCGEYAGRTIFATNVGGVSNGTTTFWSTDGTSQGTTQLGSVNNRIVGSAVISQGKVYFLVGERSRAGSDTMTLDLATNEIATTSSRS